MSRFGNLHSRRTGGFKFSTPRVLVYRAILSSIVKEVIPVAIADCRHHCRMLLSNPRPPNKCDRHNLLTQKHGKRNVASINQSFWRGPGRVAADRSLASVRHHPHAHMCGEPAAARESGIG